MPEMAASEETDDPAAPLAWGLEVEAATGKDLIKPGAGDRSAAFLAAVLRPWYWIVGIAEEVNASLVFGIMVVYGVSQGFGGAYNRVVVEYYWKDVQGAAPWQVQFYRGISFLPWNVKPLYGFLTDAFPMAGYHRRPYFILPGLLSIAAVAGVALGGKLHDYVAVILFTAGSLAAAIGDVTIDAEVARKTREHPALGPDMQALCSGCSSVGNLIGFASSGMAVHALGSQGAFGLLFIPAALFLVLGVIFYEERDSCGSNQAWENLRHVLREMWSTLRQPQVWRPALYMYLSWALCPVISEAKFYWYTNTTVGPGFSQDFIGIMYAVGSVGTLGASFVYNKYLRECSFRSMLRWSQFLLAAAGMLDLLLVFRINLRMHLPDSFFVLLDESLTGALYRLKWMPLLVMCAKLCPPGIEGTFFAFLMSVDNIGMFSAVSNGGILLKLCHVVRQSTAAGPGQTDFRLLWLAILIRNFMLLLPLMFLFLVPDTGPSVEILCHEPILLENEAVSSTTESCLD